MYGLIKKNTYQDSVNLMLISSKLSSMEGVNKVSIMMGTPANKEIFENTGMYVPALEEAGPNDICIVVDTKQESLVADIEKNLEEMIAGLTKSGGEAKIPASRTLDGSLKYMPEANLALYSIPGEYIGQEAEKALDKNCNVMIFSDNVSIEDEKRLKQKADEKGLLVMGPDCGTSILGGVPLAFANVIPQGNIGVVGASGTGIQEITTIIGRQGLGISHAIGLGGRDLSQEIGGISALAALTMLEEDETTQVVVFVSKPPAEAVMEKIIARFDKMTKPVVAVFLGNRPKQNTANITFAWTLEDAALEAARLMKRCLACKEAVEYAAKVLAQIKTQPKQRGIVGIYCGGTLAGETAMLMEDKFGLAASKSHPEGYMFKHGASEIIDYGDDAYTQGHPHPMIDPTTRVRAIQELAKRDDVAVLLLDNVLGYGSSDDMAGAIGPAITTLMETKQKEGKPLVVLASVCGTELDPQVYSQQVEKLQQAGAIVMDTNAQAVYAALAMLDELDTETKAKKTPAESMVNQPVNVLNIGLKKFAPPIKEHGGEVVQYNWSPIAGGDKNLQSLLERLRNK